jgi:dTDP-glucose 4,6-dehydratase
MNSANKRLFAEDLSLVERHVGPLWERLRGKRLFVTGGTGIVGKTLLDTLTHCRQVYDLDCRLTLLSRRPKAFQEMFPHLADSTWVTVCEGDVRDFSFPEGQFDYVVHAAADCTTPSDANTLFETCVLGTRRVLDFAKSHGVTDFLYISSGAVYGAQPPDLDGIPETYRGAPDPLVAASGYAEGKRAGEWLSCAYGREFGFDVKIARIFSMAGPYIPLDNKFAFGNFIRDVLRRQPIVIQGDGNVYRSYLYLADVAVWLWTILLRGKPGVAYNVSGLAGNAVSMVELAERINQVLGGNSPIKIMTPRVAGKPAERYVADVTKAQAELGLQSTMTLDDAIRSTARWNR